MTLKMEYTRSQLDLVLIPRGHYQLVYLWDPCIKVVSHYHTHYLLDNFIDLGSFRHPCLFHIDPQKPHPRIVLPKYEE